MADHDNGEERTSRGADWEVVSLTSSAYAAAPAPSDFEPTSGGGLNENITEHESSAALFMSGHFVFPPSEHENLPVEPDLSEVQSVEQEHNICPIVVDCDEELNDSGQVSMQTVPDSASDTFYSGTHKTCTKLETDKPSDENVDSPGDYKKPDEDEFDGSNLPYHARWKKHAICLYRHAKESSTFWSVFVAAAVMGIVVLGRRWKHDKWLGQETRLRFSVTDAVCLLPLWINDRVY